MSITMPSPPPSDVEINNSSDSLLHLTDQILENVSSNLSNSLVNMEKPIEESSNSTSPLEIVSTVQKQDFIVNQVFEHENKLNGHLETSPESSSQTLAAVDHLLTESQTEMDDFQITVPETKQSPPSLTSISKESDSMDSFISDDDLLLEPKSLLDASNQSDPLVSMEKPIEEPSNSSQPLETVSTVQKQDFNVNQVVEHENILNGHLEPSPESSSQTLTAVDHLLTESQTEMDDLQIAVPETKQSPPSLTSISKESDSMDSFISDDHLLLEPKSLPGASNISNSLVNMEKPIEESSNSTPSLEIVTTVQKQDFNVNQVFEHENKLKGRLEPSAESSSQNLTAFDHLVTESQTEMDDLQIVVPETKQSLPSLTSISKGLDSIDSSMSGDDLLLEPKSLPDASNILENVDEIDYAIQEESPDKQAEKSSDNHPMMRNYKQQLRERKLNVLNNDYITADYEINRLLPKKRVARSKSSQDTASRSETEVEANAETLDSLETANQPGPSQKIIKIKPKSLKAFKSPKNLGSFENRLSKDDLETFLYTSDLSLLSTDTLKRTVKSLKNQTRNLRKPEPTVQEKIEDIEFSCFKSEKDFENYSKFEVKELSEKLLQRRSQELKIHERASISSQFDTGVPKVAKVRKTPFRRNQAIVPFREQFDYHTDFLDEDEIYSPHMDFDFESFPIVSTPTSTSTATSVPPRKKQKSNVVFVNAAPKVPKAKLNETASLVGSGKKRSFIPQVSNKQASPNKRLKVVIPSHNNSTIHKSNLLPQPNIDRLAVSPNENDANKLIDSTNGVRRFEKFTPEMLCEVSDEAERRSLYNQFFKIVTKIYSRCRAAHLQVYSERYRRTLVKPIKGDEAIREIKSQLRPPVRPIIQQKSNTTPIFLLPTGKVVNPNSTAGFKPQVVNRKLIFAPSSFKPAGISSSSTPTMNRFGAVTTTSSAPNAPSPTLINSGNIKLAPTGTKQVFNFVRHVNSEGKAITTQPQNHRIFILKPQGQGGTLVPVTPPNVMNTNGQSQPMRVVLSKPGLPVGSKIITATTVVPTQNTGIRVNSNMGTSNSIKWVLNPSSPGAVQALNNMKNSTFRIGQSPTTTGGQHVLIGGGTNKIATSAGKLFALRPNMPTSNIAATTVAQAMVSSSSVISNFNSQSISYPIGANQYNSNRNEQAINFSNIFALSTSPHSNPQHNSVNAFTDTSLLANPNYHQDLPYINSLSNTYKTRNSVNVNLVSNVTKARSSLTRNEDKILSEQPDELMFVDHYQNISDESLVVTPNNLAFYQGNSGLSSTSLENNTPWPFNGSQSGPVQEQYDDDDEPVLCLLDQPSIEKPKVVSDISILDNQHSRLPLESIPVDLNKPYTILANLLYSLYIHVPNARPNLEKLRSLLPDFLSQNYITLCKDILRTMFHLDQDSKQLINQLKYELTRQKRLLQQFNDLKAQIVSDSSDPTEVLPSFEMIKPRRAVEFTIQKENEHQFRHLMQKLLRKDMQAITKEKRDIINLKSVLCYEKMCNEQLAHIAAVNGTDCIQKQLCK